MPQPLQESDIIFSSAASALKAALGELKRNNLTLKNRLRSIREDARFVCTVADAYQLPLVANERCGSWYIPPDRKRGSAYFKSTDGHFGKWTFSLRRLNLQVFDILEQHRGCVIVDSTRRGKSMPDALSKTVPFWVAVLNRLLFPGNSEWHELSTPLDVLSESEHTQMENRLEECFRNLSALALDVEGLRLKLRNKPIRVTWQRPGDSIAEGLSGAEAESPNLIVLCTASNQTSNETSATSEYVQGAADDPESWSLGLDASVFWANCNALLAASEDDLPSIIETLVAESRAGTEIRTPVRINPTCNLWIAANSSAATLHPEYDLLIYCAPMGSFTPSPDMAHKYIHLECTSGKVGSRQLRAQLSKLESGRHRFLSTSKILVSCESGKDISVGVALALLCLCFDDQGQLSTSAAFPSPAVNKQIIKQRLSWIMVSMPDASPSRATLQSINAHLMG